MVYGSYEVQFTGFNVCCYRHIQLKVTSCQVPFFKINPAVRYGSIYQIGLLIRITTVCPVQRKQVSSVAFLPYKHAECV